jgi:hypothetical protein
MFEKDEPKNLPDSKKGSNGILWVEAIAFSVLITLSWLTEMFKFPHLIYGEQFIPNWHRAVLRTLVILVIWFWVFVGTRKLLRRLHYLEEFLRVCSWCRKVSYENEWLEMEKFLNSKFDTKTSHGVCPNCLRKKKEEIAEHKTPTTIV